jgi:hypothetical protein
MLKSSSLCLYSSNFGTFWLKIAQFWPFEEISIFSNGGHLKKSSPLKLLSQFQPNFADMILRWSPFKIVSVSAVLYPRWPPLLKIEIGQNQQNFKVHKNPVIYVKKLIIVLIQFKFWHFLA